MPLSDTPYSEPIDDHGTRAHWLWPALIVLPALMALAAPINHDEDQYVAAAALVARHLAIYRDFLSLQTPLHAFVLAPLALLRPHAFVAMRLATALLATLLLGAVHAIQRRRSVAPGAAMAATLLLLCCTSFHVGASVVRNDALPALLETVALGIVLEDVGVGGALLAGLCIGLAISAKASYAPFAPLLLLGILWEAHDGRRLFAATVAIAIGFIPTAWCWWNAPDAFWWGVVDYARIAPARFYAAGGNGFWLTLPGRLMRLTLSAAEGPALVALVIVSVALWRRRSAMSRTDRWLLLFLAAGAIAALIPSPAWRQYLLPVLPPLFVGLGMAIDAGRLRSRPVMALLLISAIVGLARPARDIATAFVSAPPVIANESVARQIAARGIHAPVTTASTHVAIDLPDGFDPRLATGVFILRGAGLLDPAKAIALHVLTPETLAAQFDAAPPPAIVTGLDPPSDLAAAPQDIALTRYAQERGYRALPLTPAGMLFLRPVPR